MDGCIYRYPETFPNLANETATLALFKCLGEEVPTNSFNEFVRQAKTSFIETGSPVTHFAEKYKIQQELLEAVRHKLLPVTSIVPIGRLPRAFRQATMGGHKSHLATHSHINFTSRAIPHLNLSDTFRVNHNVITLDQYGHEYSKCKSPRLIIDSAENMGVALEDIAFVEDTAKNFEFIKDHDSRVRTVLISWGRDVQKTSKVDHIFRDPLEVARAIRPPKLKTMVFAKALR